MGVRDGARAPARLPAPAARPAPSPGPAAPSAAPARPGTAPEASLGTTRIDRRLPHLPQACIGFGVRLLVKMVYGGLEVGSLDEAARCLQRAIELSPERLVHRVVYARILLKQGKRDAAVEQLDAAVSMNVEDINAKLERLEAFRMREKLGLPQFPPLSRAPGAAAAGPPAPLVPAVPPAVVERVSMTSAAASASSASCASAGGSSAALQAAPVLAAAAS